MKLNFFNRSIKAIKTFIYYDDSILIWDESSKKRLREKPTEIFIIKDDVMMQVNHEWWNTPACAIAVLKRFVEEWEKRNVKN